MRRGRRVNPGCGSRNRILFRAELRRKTQELATRLFSDYVLPFEVVSVLLLAAVIGGVFLAKQEAPQAPTLDWREPERGSLLDSTVQDANG